MNPRLSTIDRLTAARPDDDIAVLSVSRAERSRLLQDILGSVEVPVHASRRRVAVGAALAAAVLGLAVGDVSGTRAPTAEPPIGPRGTRVVVLDQVRLAMAGSSSSIVHLRSDPGNGVLWESWHDEATGRSRSVSSSPHGAPMYDHEFTPTEEGLHVKVVSHADRGWWEYTAPAERGMRVGPTPDEVRAQVADGTLREAGREAGEGGDLIRFRSEGTSDDTKRSQPFDLWVDASTHLPIRSATEQPGGRPPIVTWYEWLPRDQGAPLHVTVPEGFRRFERAPDSPVVADAKG